MNNARKSKDKLIKDLEAAQREVDIQTALEGIRDLALAMQTTEEIGPVVSETRAALIDLGIRPFRTVIALCDESVDSCRSWSAKQSQHFSYNGEASWLAYRKVGSVMYAPRPKRKHWMMVKMNKRQLISEFRKMRNAAQMSGVELPADWLDRLVSESPIPYYGHNFYFMGGFISIGMDRELDRDEIAIARRIAETFGFAYKRFLDLQDKERHAREAEVEAALERVRAQALAMQASTEIGGVTDLMYDEVQALGFALEWLSIAAQDASGHSVFWSAGERHTVRDRRIPKRSKSKIWQTINAESNKALARGEDVYTFEVRGRQVRSLVRPLLLGKSEKETEKRIAILPKSLVLHRVFHEHGFLAFIREHRMADEDLEVAKRFTDVFSFAYDRFLDLQDKERRARKAEVEAAIERVRSRALGMQESAEIKGVATALHDEFSTLGYQMSRIAILFPDAETRTVKVWRGHPLGVGDPEFENAATEPLDRRLGWVKRWENGERRWMVKIRDIERIKASFARYLSASGISKSQIRKRVDAIPNEIYEHVVNFDPGLIVYNSDTPFNDADFEVAERFTDVFAVAYQRFEELKQKEEQARVAEQRAAVDRVRAEAMAMAATDDIANVVKTLWEGLVSQDLEFVTLVFRVEDAQAQELQMYVATLDGASDLVFPEPNLIRRDLLTSVNLYRSKMPLEMVQVAVQERSGVYSGLARDVNEDVRTLWGFELPDELIERTRRLVVPFDYGQIMVIREEAPFAEADLERAKSFAEGVSLGFARYFDFRRLEAQNVALEKANEEVRTATEMKSQFLASMSHELRTPMNAIIGFTRLVLRRSKNLEGRQRENLDKVQLSANHLLALINDILDLSKVEAGRMDLNLTTFKVSPLIQHCCATVGPTLGKSTVALGCEIGEDVGEAFTDEDRVRQIVINLLSNALKFTDAGEVKVTASIDDGRQMLTIAVSDTGKGIPEEALPTIFDEYRQVKGQSESAVQKGTGLGLSITKKFAELLGGTISVESEEGQGSVFTVRLPMIYRESKRC